MTYVPLATRMRPRVFSDVIGQDATVRILQAALQLDRIATSYVFSGPPGTGKTTVARLLGAALNCQGTGRLCGVCGTPQFVAYENGVRCGETCRNGHGGADSIEGPARPCGACSSCLDVQEGRHALVVEVDAASDRGVAMVEALQTIVAQVVPDGGHRVFILDEAHMLSGKAWAAFLKTIEEPAPSNTFVFVTTDRDKVISTVKSRSSGFVFRPVTDETIAQMLARALARPVDPSILLVIAREAHGSVRDALHLLDKVDLLGADVTVEDVERLVGIDTETMRDLADILLDPGGLDFRRCVTGLDGVLARGYSPAEAADAIIRILRDVRVFRTGYRGASMSYLPADRLVENARHLDDATLDRFYGAAVRLVESRAIDRIALETAFVRMKSVDTCLPTR